MDFVRLDANQLGTLASIARSAEGQFLRERVLKPMLDEIDRKLRRCPVSEVAVLQGYAQAIDGMIDLLSPQPASMRKQAERGVTALQDDA
jgi:hypothetical protein